MSSIMKIMGTALCATWLLAAPGCKPSEPKPDPNAQPKVEPKIEPKVEPPKPEPPKPMTADELAKWYVECWNHFAAKDWDKFGNCYSDTATADSVDSGMPALTGKDIVEKGAKPFSAGYPDAAVANAITLVNGRKIAGVWLVTGTNSGDMQGMNGQMMPATNKKIGFLMAQTLTVGEDNKASEEHNYFDVGTMLAQLGVNPMPARPVMDKLPGEAQVVIATDSDIEKANLEIVNQAMDAFNKHDIKAFGALLADDMIAHPQAAPKDTNKKEQLAFMQELWKGFSDVKVEVTDMWAAGDYVVIAEHRTGTNDGDVKSWKLKKTGKTVDYHALVIARIEGGKFKESWDFENGMAPAMQLGMVPPPGADKPAK